MSNFLMISSLVHLLIKRPNHICFNLGFLTGYRLFVSGSLLVLVCKHIYTAHLCTYVLLKDCVGKVYTTP